MLTTAHASKKCVTFYVVYCKYLAALSKYVIILALIAITLILYGNVIMVVCLWSSHTNHNPGRLTANRVNRKYQQIDSFSFLRGTLSGVKMWLNVYEFKPLI